MVPELLKKSRIFHFLHQIDLDLAQQCRLSGCDHCGGPLHQANYPRQPWGAPKNTPDEQKIRQSLCCGREGCRKRKLPPSCLYLGRKKYWSGIIVVVMALRENRFSDAAAKVMRMFGISYKTILRWRTWFRDVFPNSAQWKTIRGAISATVDDRRLPADLLDYFVQTKGSDEKGLIGCLQILAAV